MQQHFKYYIKHAYGISKEFNQHSTQNPWHGAGQGTGDAVPCWVVQSHLLITDYHSQAMLWPLPNPISHSTLPLGIDAFMDDTNHLLSNSSDNHLHTILPAAQHNIDLWQGLIQASGGTLNLSKCSWTPFLWHFNQHGSPRLVDLPPTLQFQIMAPDRSGTCHMAITQ